MAAKTADALVARKGGKSLLEISSCRSHVCKESAREKKTGKGVLRTQSAAESLRFDMGIFGDTSEP